MMILNLQHTKGYNWIDKVYGEAMAFPLRSSCPRRFLSGERLCGDSCFLLHLSFNTTSLSPALP